MTYDTILLRYGEIFLKGKNKDFFERKLVDNIRKIALSGGNSKTKIIKTQGRLLGDYFKEHSALRKVFGLVSYSPAVRVEKSTEEIQSKAVELLKEKKGTFRIATKRSDKSFPITSPEFNRLVGEHVERKTDLRFSYGEPDITLEIEINQEGAYLFVETIPCFGGLPAGVEGNILLLVENDASILAGLLFMKRGCNIFPVAFGDKDLSLLQKFSPVPLQLGKVRTFQEIEEMTKENKITVLVSGQILKNYKSYPLNFLVMRPLIAYSEEKIKEQLRLFGKE
ncbi:MAG: THUMP domain-containing protein [Nanoarchaeota archaeon]